MYYSELVELSECNSVEELKVYNSSQVVGINKCETYVTVTHSEEVFNNPLYQKLCDDSLTDSHDHIGDGVYESQFVLE
jgi:hypothetical protein